MSEFAKRLAEHDLTPEELFREHNLTLVQINRIVFCVNCIIQGFTLKAITEKTTLELKDVKSNLDLVKKIVKDRELQESLLEPDFVQLLEPEEIENVFLNFVEKYNQINAEKQNRPNVKGWSPKILDYKLFQLMLTTDLTAKPLQQSLNLTPEQIHILYKLILNMRLTDSDIMQLFFVLSQGQSTLISVTARKIKILKTIEKVLRKLTLQSMKNDNRDNNLFEILEKFYLNNLSPNRRTEYLNNKLNSKNSVIQVHLAFLNRI